MKNRDLTKPVLLLPGLLLAASALLPAEALACGCFAPPDPTVPVIQAGERILFAQKDGQVTAHIQIQYSAQAGKEFGWILPLPAVPENSKGERGKIDIGTDELFTQLTSATQPKYRLTVKYDNCGGNSRLDSPQAGGAAGPPNAPDAGASGEKSPLIAQDTVGPFDTAVLDGSNKQIMLDWLKANGYFVPANTENVLDPYVHKGAVFLALKLHAGYSAGDLQPVVLRYASDLPMIPIELTSVGATRNMGVQVWMLGNGRAIPRNYYHTVINDAQIDWRSAGSNYNNVIINAVGESTGHHAFVTEYAGSSTIAQNLLDAPGRFSNLAQLPLLTDPRQFVRGVLNNGFALNGQLTALLGRFIPEPQLLQKAGVTPAQFYQQIEGYLSDLSKYKDDTDFNNKLAAFNSAAVAAELNQNIVVPTQRAAQLLRDFPYLTRLYSTLSPEDMNKDPVFSYNPSLPDYSNIHTATLTYHCSGGGLFNSSGGYGSATLETEGGFRVDYGVDQLNKFQPLPVPYSARIETLRETGAPEIVVDNTGAIKSGLGTGGCSVPTIGLGVGAGAAAASGPLALLLGSAALLLRRRRSRG